MFISREKAYLAIIQSYVESDINVVHFHFCKGYHDCRVLHGRNTYEGITLLFTKVPLPKPSVFMWDLMVEADHQVPESAYFDEHFWKESNTCSVPLNWNWQILKTACRARISKAMNQQLSKQTKPNLRSVVCELHHDRLCSDFKSKSSKTGSWKGFRSYNFDKARCRNTLSAAGSLSKIILKRECLSSLVMESFENACSSNTTKYCTCCLCHH